MESQNFSKGKFFHEILSVQMILIIQFLGGRRRVIFFFVFFRGIRSMMNINAPDSFETNLFPLTMLFARLGPVDDGVNFS